MRYIHIFLTFFALLPKVEGQSLQLNFAGHGQMRSQAPFIWGPSLGLRALTASQGYAISLHAAWAKGRSANEQNAYSLRDELFRWGGSVEKHLHTQGRFNVFAGVLIENFQMERYVSGLNLGWGWSHMGNGFMVGGRGRADLRLGSVTSVFLGIEPLYAIYSSTSEVTEFNRLRGRPLTDGFSLRGSLGVAFTFLPADERNSRPVWP